MVERVPYGLEPWGGRDGDIEFGGVGRGWFFVTGTLLAATAAKLSRPPAGFGISRAVDAMLAISLEGSFVRFSEVTRHGISLCSQWKRVGGVEAAGCRDDRADSLDLREKRGELLKRRDNEAQGYE